MNYFTKVNLTSCLLLTGLIFSAEAKNVEAGLAESAGVRLEQRLQTPQRNNKVQSVAASGFTGEVESAGEPRRVVSGLTNIYGSLWSTSASDAAYGLYSITPSGAELKWSDPAIRRVGLPMQIGWLDDGKLCGYYVVTNYGTLSSYYYAETDFATGELITLNQLSGDNGFFMCAAYNCDDRQVYGYGLSSNGLFAYMKAPADDPDNMTTIKEFMTDEDCVSMTYNPYDQKLYGVTADGDFVNVDQEGNQTVLMNLSGMNLMAVYSGLCYAPNEELFYWNPIFGDDTTAIYALDIRNSTKNRVETCPNDEQYVFFVTPDRRMTPGTPEAPTISSISNEGGTLSPTIGIAMPTMLLDGGEIQNSLTWHARLDGQDVLSGESMPGSEVEVTFENIEEGMHVFSFYVSNGDDDSDFTSESFYVGVDTPKTPENVVLGNRQVTWDAVSAGVHDGYLNPGEIEYTVCLLDLREEEPQPINIGVTQETVLSIPQEIADGLKRTVATVVATAGGKTSEAGYSNEVALGASLSLDVFFLPEREDFESMTVIDANNDGRTWSYSMIQESFKSSFTSKGKGRMDDWLIFPAIEFPSDEDVYEFAADVCICNSSSPDEYLEVLMGETPEAEAMDIVILPTFQPVRAIETYSATFTVPSAGNYYIALHTTSMEFQEGVLVSNVNISNTSTSGIRRPETGQKENSIKGGRRSITAKGAAGVELTIYRTDGALAARVTPDTDHYEIPVMPGSYIVCTGPEAIKVIVF